MSTTAKKGSRLGKTILVGFNRAEGEADNDQKDSVAAVPPAEVSGLQAPTPSNQFEDDERVDTPPVVKDLLRDIINEKKEKGRVKTENLKMTAQEYLEKSKPENYKNNIKTALNTLKSVLKVLHPGDKRDLLELPNDTLADYLEEFFMSVLKEDGSPYNASTLGTYYNGIARFFVDEKKLDIKKEPEFVRLSKVISRRQEESVKAGKIPGINASNPIPQEVLAEVSAQGKIGLGDPRALAANVIQCFEVGFGIRSRTEMYEIMNGDIKIGPLKPNGVPEYIELGERMTKTRRGKRGQGKIMQWRILLLCLFSKGSREFAPRIDSNDEKPENCLLRPFMMMQAKKTPAMLSAEMPVFLSCKNLSDPSQSAVWFINQRYS